MPYAPGPKDIYCTNPACRQPYPKSLPSCPMCDWPTGKPFTPPPASVVLPEPQPAQPVQLVPVILHPRSNPFLAAIKQVPVAAWGIAGACALVLLVWAVARIWVLREEQAQLERNVNAARSIIREFSAAPPPR